MDELRKRIEAFGVRVREVDGHDPQSMSSVLHSETSGLQVVILKTVKGKGVSFMENQMEWHYLPLTQELYSRAVKELQGR